MKAISIVKKLMENLPKHTTDVSSVFNPETISITGTTVSVMKAAHGLVNNQLISVVGTKLVNPVSSLTVDSDDIATVTTAYDNDLTVGYQETVRLESVSEPTINNDYALVEQDDNNTFYVSDFVFAGTIPNDIKLIETRTASIDCFTAITFVDVDNFTFVSDFALDDDLEIIPSSVSINYNMRISRGADIKRLIDHYNAQTPLKLELRVVLGGTSINKSEDANTDSDMEQGGSNEWDGYLLTPFSVFCFQTLSSDSTGGAARDSMSDLRINLYKSILGEEIETNTVAGVNDSVYPIGDDAYEYQKGYYIHEFKFAQQIAISLGDTAKSDTTSVACNSVDFDIMDTVDGQNILISGVAELRESI